MKINSINIQNFIGARDVDITLSKPITLICGKNGSGKSSIQESIRLALCGETVRVGLKKDYPMLVSDGAQFGVIELEGTANAGDKWDVSMSLPSGKGNPLTNPALPYVLDAQRFAHFEPNERLAFLFGLMGIKTTGDGIKKSLAERGIDPDAIESVLPLLRNGFDLAHKEAQSRARDAKASWRTITGETYGANKAEKWVAEIHQDESREVDIALVPEMEKRLKGLAEELDQATRKAGGLTADQKRYTDSQAQIESLRAKSQRYAAISEKLQFDETELAKLQKRLDEVRPLATGTRRIGLVHTLAYALSDMIADAVETELPSYERAGEALHTYEFEHGELPYISAPNPEAMNALPELEEAVRRMARSVENDKRDLTEADKAARELSAIEQMVSPPDPVEIEVVRQQIADLNSERASLQGRLRVIQSAVEAHGVATAKTSKALEAHKTAVMWTTLADALAPDGIPGEMLASAITPLNERLATNANEAQWMRINIGLDMEIFAGEEGAPPRAYALLSESEKWRADAMIAEAVSHLSGVRMLVLDRFDVLDTKGRVDLVYWLDDLVLNGQIDCALIFGTLKSLPQGLPSCVEALWIEDGVLSHTQRDEVA